MKNVNKKFWSLFLSMLILIGIAACDPDSEDADESGYLGNFLIIESQQVWSPNYETGKLSNICKIFNDDRDVEVCVLMPQYDDNGENIIDARGNNVIIKEVIDSGSIKNGILNFEVNELGDNFLLKTGEDLLFYVFREWWVDDNKDGKAETISISPEAARGNIITILTDSASPEGLIKEGFSGSKTSLCAEYIYFVYVDRNCTITAEQGQDAIGYTTFNGFNINLRKGWNAICKKETYRTTGYANISIEIKYPDDFRWILLPAPSITTSITSP